MGNMIYCRFENTSNDLQDCVDNWESLDEKSTQYEKNGKAKIIELAKEIVEMEGFTIEDDD